MKSISLSAAVPAAAALTLTGSKDKATARLPLAKNLVLANGKALELEGLVVPAEMPDKVS